MVSRRTSSKPARRRSCRRSGSGAAIDYVQSIGKARIRAHENDVVKYAHQRLTELNSLRIIGNAKEKGSIVSFEIKGAHPHDIATIIDRAGVAVRAGTHCVMPLLARYGVTATCRASFGLYNTQGGGRYAGAGLDQGAGHVRMSEETKTADPRRCRTRSRPRAEARSQPKNSAA